MNETCVCGDVADEHDPETKACLIEGCRCFYYDPEPPEESEES